MLNVRFSGGASSDNTRITGTGQLLLAPILIFSVFLANRMRRRMCGVAGKIKTAARQGDPTAQYLVGASHRHGYGVSENPQVLSVGLRRLPTAATETLRTIWVSV